MTTTISKTERCDPDASRRAAKTIVQVWGSFDARTVAPVHRGGGSESRTPRTTAGLGRIAVEALSRSGSESLYASSSSSRTANGGERSLKDRAERSRRAIALAQGWVRACRGRPLGHLGCIFRARRRCVRPPSFGWMGPTVLASSSSSSDSWREAEEDWGKEK